LHEVASDLKKSGFHVDQVLQEIGLITGKGADAAAHKARKVKGVTDVSANHEISIGPPDSSDPVRTQKGPARGAPALDV
jgi:hypothetical protein